MGRPSGILPLTLICPLGESDLPGMGFTTAGDALQKRLDQIDR